MRALLGVAFILFGIVWGLRIYRVYRRDRSRKAMAIAFDFVSGYAVDFVLIVGLLVLGVLFLVGA